MHFKASRLSSGGRALAIVPSGETVPAPHLVPRISPATMPTSLPRGFRSLDKEKMLSPEEASLIPRFLVVQEGGVNQLCGMKAAEKVR